MYAYSRHCNRLKCFWSGKVKVKVTKKKSRKIPNKIRVSPWCSVLMKSTLSASLTKTINNPATREQTVTVWVCLTHHNNNAKSLILMFATMLRSIMKFKQTYQQWWNKRFYTLAFLVNVSRAFFSSYFSSAISRYLLGVWVCVCVCLCKETDIIAIIEREKM